jgi:hypothetical protein
MSDETRPDGPINEEELPDAGNSNAKLYPKVEDAKGDQPQDDEQQATHGDAAAVREDEGPDPNDAM